MKQYEQQFGKMRVAGFMFRSGSKSPSQIGSGHMIRDLTGGWELARTKLGRLFGGAEKKQTNKNPPYTKWIMKWIIKSF